MRVKTGRQHFCIVYHKHVALFQISGYIFENFMFRAMIDKFDGKPVGLETLAATINEDAGTIEDVYEPYLLQLGFIEPVAQGICNHTRACSCAD